MEGPRGAQRSWLRVDRASASSPHPGAFWPLGREEGNDVSQPGGTGANLLLAHCPVESTVCCPLGARPCPLRPTGCLACPPENGHAPRVHPRAPVHSCLLVSEERGESTLLLPSPQPAPSQPADSSATGDSQLPREVGLLQPPPPQARKRAQRPHNGGNP